MRGPDQDITLNVLLSVGAFLVSFGVGACCAIRGSDRKIESELLKISKKFTSNTKKLIENERKLRSMDHAFRLLIFVESL